MLDEGEFPEDVQLEDESDWRNLYTLHPDTLHTQMSNSTLPHPAPIVGGRLAQFAQEWRSIHPPKLVMDVIQHGHCPAFIDNQPPPLVTDPAPYDLAYMGANNLEKLMPHIRIMQEKGALVEVQDPSSPGFYSRMFTIPKKSGVKEDRPIFNCKELNSYLVVPRFKMETTSSIMKALHRGDWGSSMDFKDGYFHVLIHPRFRKYLRLCIHGRVYEFWALPFGLATAPWLFTQIVKAMLAFLHTQGIKCHAYIDDWLIRGSSPFLVTAHTQIVVDLAVRLGWIINIIKSSLDPTQKLIFIGIDFDLLVGKCYPPIPRLLKLETLLSRFILQRQATAHQLQSVLGVITSAEKQVPWGPAHKRYIQAELRAQWNQHTGHPNQRVHLGCHAIQDMRWWADRSHTRVGMSLEDFNPHRILYTDSSLDGWGAHLDHLEVRGTWDSKFQNQSINWKELNAVFLALLHFKDTIQGQEVLLMTDNTSTVAYINKQGGTKSILLTRVALDIMSWTECNQVNLKARHLPGKKNILADLLSREGQVINTEWMIHPQILSALWKFWERPLVDLFATKHTKQLQLYVSPLPDPQAWAVEALTTPWRGFLGYAYPPPALLKEVLNKVQLEGADLVLIAPFWPAQAWFPDLLPLLLDYPIELPCIEKMLKQPKQQVFHSKPSVFRLHAWRLSGRLSATRSFQQKWQKELLSRPKGSLPTRSMTPSGSIL